MKSFTFLPKIIINFKIIYDITTHYDDDDDDDRIIFRIFFLSQFIYSNGNTVAPEKKYNIVPYNEWNKWLNINDDHHLQTETVCVCAITTIR